MRVLFVASEAATFARTGGLGDVIGALPISIAQSGHDVKVIMPLYAGIDTNLHRISPLPQSTIVEVGNERFTCLLYRTLKQRVEWLFVECQELFARNGLYQDKGTGKDYPDNDVRFAAFSRAVLALVNKLNFKPDLIHIHDWQTSLIPALLKEPSKDWMQLVGTPTVLTLHNVGYQGQFEGKRFPLLGLPPSYFAPVTGAFEFYGKVNFLKGGIVLADKITTVSPTYAKEISESSEFGSGLEGVLQSRKQDLVGILNGADYNVWTPSRDKEIPFKYNEANLARKRMNKVELLRSAGLPIRGTTPLLAMISRLADQKGFDLVIEAASQLLSRDLQVVILGSGDQKYVQALEGLAKRFPEKFKYFAGFDDPLSHKIEAAADMFLMPSRYEPCGLNQMYSLRYGTVPIVRKVGGLSDSVREWNPLTGEGTGFLFDEYAVQAMLEAIDRALTLFPQKRKWGTLVKNGMREDFSWTKSAAQYLSIYSSVQREARLHGA